MPSLEDFSVSKKIVANGKILIALHCIKQLNLKESP